MFPVLRWVLGPALAAILWSLDFDLEPKAHLLSGLMVWTVLWWIFEPVPLAATSLLGASGLVILGITDGKSALAPFAHPLVFLFMGGFIIAKAMSVHGLDRRIALFILTRKLVEGRPVRILIALLSVTAFLSMWITNTATTAMMLPITLGVLTHLFPNDTQEGHIRHQGIVLIAVAYSSSIGGIATPIGSTPNVIVMGLLDTSMGMQLTFFEWMAFGLPTSIAILALLSYLTLKKLPDLPRRISTQKLSKDYRALGKVNPGESNTIKAALTTVLLWTLPSFAVITLGRTHEISRWFKAHLPEAVSAIIGACLLFVLRHKGRPTLKWKQAMDIDWGSLLLFGGGLSLGTQMFKTGLAKVLGENILMITGGGSMFWLFVGIAVLFAIFFTETTSNTATANMLIPLIISTTMASQSGLSPFIPAVGVALACSLAFMMPVSTPPNAIVYGSGKIKIGQMIRQGFPMNIGSWVILMISLFLIDLILRI